MYGCMGCVFNSRKTQVRISGESGQTSLPVTPPVGWGKYNYVEKF